MNLEQQKLVRSAPKSEYQDACRYAYREGTDFFGLFLHPTELNLSSYIWTEDGLEDTAIKNKYRLLAELLGVRRGMRVLELGCGFGGFSRYLAETHECIVEGVTISEDQYLHCVEHAGPRNKYVLSCWSDLPDKKYDAIVADEFVVHAVDREALFAKCRGMLNAGAVFVYKDLHVTRDSYNTNNPVSEAQEQATYKGSGYYTTYATSMKQAEDAGFLREESLSVGTEHYVRTLEHCNKRLVSKLETLNTLNKELTREYRIMIKAYLRMFREKPNVLSLDVTKLIACEGDKYA